MASEILFLTQIRLFDVMAVGMSNQKMIFYVLLTSEWHYCLRLENKKLCLLFCFLFGFHYLCCHNTKKWRT